MKNKEIDSRVIELPNKDYCGVYLLCTNKGELVYVGVSSNVYYRLKQHKISGKYWDKLLFIEEPDYVNALIIEGYYIDNYNPRYNKSGGKLQSYKFGIGCDMNLIKSKITYPGGWGDNPYKMKTQKI